MRPFSLFMTVVLVFAVGCKPSKKKSVDYAQAIELHALLVAERGDEAYFDEQMQEVEGLLAKVTDDYWEHPAALKLASKIKNERARIKSEQSAREEMARKAKEPVAFQFSPSNTKPASALPPKAAPPESVVGPQPETGMSMKDFQGRFSGCFSSWQTIEVRGQGPMEGFELKDIANCRDRHPGFVGKVVLARGDQIYSFIERASVHTEQRLPDGGVVKDGGK